jgi:hypothetical protein
MQPFDPDKIPDHVWKQMNITRERFTEIRAEMEQRETSAPQPGSEAPDCALRRLSRDRKLGSERIRLADLRGRPVGLVFGSYT